MSARHVSTPATSLICQPYRVSTLATSALACINFNLKTGTVSTPRLSPDFQTLQSLIHPFALYSIQDCQGSQTLTDFYNKLSNLWNHLAQFEPIWTCPTDAAAFYAYRDRSRLHHFLMALPPNYEHIRASLLHRHPLPTVGQALSKLKSEKYCSDTHSYEDCHSRSKSKRKGYHNRQTAVVTDSSGPSPDSSSSTLTTADVETIVTQDPRTEKTIGTGRKVGRLFELESLHAPHRFVAAASSLSSHVSFVLWHSHLECKLQHILDTVRALLISASVIESFWREAALTAVCTINRTPSLVTNNISLYEKLYGTTPNYNLLRVFGSACFVLFQPYERNKLKSRSRLCCFLGYGIEHKGYRCYDPISKRFRISRHVEFWEDVKFSDISKTPTPSGLGHPLFIDSSLDIILPVTSPSSAGSPPSPNLPSRIMDDPNASSLATLPSVPCPPVRCSTRVKTAPSHLRDYFALSTWHEPRNFRKASSSPDCLEDFTLCQGYYFSRPSFFIRFFVPIRMLIGQATPLIVDPLLDATSKLLWLRWLIQDLGIDSPSVALHCDNHSAIQIAHNDVSHERTKHIEIDCHFIRHHLQQ
ncbi:hypothetical protein Acr_00g0090110 [Actinidia rufa]|uniref:Retroviral polymerase SH3-like domain-containing protein n=1 Tax=Actinidia rufa TaxID=165716 RepID=A0A7J0DY15_9ERIC|nr:hypothetical protein Acr_00g0090110 [Actinidia rufa]